MPTTKPRHMLTEDEDLARALQVAARRWPDEQDRPTMLLRHLIDTGRAVIVQELEDEGAAIEEVAGALTGLYEPGERDRLRNEWPA